MVTSRIKATNTPFGQRVLAAIVFSDVVSFSARMNADEENTLRMVADDLARMREVCEDHEGQVLKSTGDGLMMYFTSAVQAVSCALDVQNMYAAREREAQEGDALSLKHRIGIHLGDVFLSATDVMGDGVNIAARLEGEANPGGICISQTVYDVVKNKLELKTTYLGPRDLKNIKEAVPVYRIILAAQDGDEATPADVSVEGKEQGERKLPFLWIGLGIGAVAAILAVVFLVVLPEDAAQVGPEQLARTSTSRSASTPPASAALSTGKAGEVDASKPADGVGGTGGSGELVAASQPAQPDPTVQQLVDVVQQLVQAGQAQQARAQAQTLAASHAQATASTSTVTPPAAATAGALAYVSSSQQEPAAASHQDLLDWMKASMGAYSKGWPLKATFKRKGLDLPVDAWHADWDPYNDFCMVSSLRGARAYRYDKLVERNFAGLLYSLLEVGVRRGTPTSSYLLQGITNYMTAHDLTELQERTYTLLQ